MINQTRTLLTNKPASFFDTLASPVYVPPDFVPLELPSEFAELYALLFPKSDDPYVVDKIAGGIMQALHAPELLPYTCYPDSRVTYEGVADMSELALSPVTLTMVVNATDVVPHYRLTPSAIPVDVRFFGKHTWRCSRVDNFMLNVQYSRQGTSEQYRVTTGNTRSAYVPLFPGYLDLYFDMPTKYLTGQLVVDVQLLVEPVFNLGACLAAMKDLIKHVALFSKLYTLSVGYETVLSQLKTVYLNSPEAILQFGAIVLPYVYQCDVLRTKS